MPRRSVTLPDPVRRRVGDHVIEARAYHLAQARKRHEDALGLARRVRHQMAQIRAEARWHSARAEDAREIIEAVS
jgi:hypothetical protein